MKKVIVTILTIGLAAACLAGCGGSGAAKTSAQSGGVVAETAAQGSGVASEAGAAQSGKAASEAGVSEGAVSAAMEGEITVVSREDGSGTRGAFIELLGVEQENEAGEKVDMTTLDAEVTNSTSVMMTTVAGNAKAIGYISLGSLNDTVKALAIDGVDATVDNIKSGDYKLARSFNIAVKDGLSGTAQDFITFIMSEQGQAVVEENGYISQGNEGAYEASGVSGKIVVAGSSSVTPVMEKLSEAYKELNPDVAIEVQQSDSTTGMTSVAEGVCDIGMASRELKESELEQGLTPTVIAMDGIAVIVNNNAAIDGLSSETVRDIYTGEITDWADVQ